MDWTLDLDLDTGPDLELDNKLERNKRGMVIMENLTHSENPK